MTSRKDSVSELQSILDHLTLDISDTDLDNIIECADSASSEDTSINTMTDMIYEKCISDREFAKTGAFICDKVAALENNGTKFRSTLLSKVQLDYKGKF